MKHLISLSLLAILFFSCEKEIVSNSDAFKGKKNWKIEKMTIRFSKKNSDGNSNKSVNDEVYFYTEMSAGTLTSVDSNYKVLPNISLNKFLDFSHLMIIKPTDKDGNPPFSPINYMEGKNNPMLQNEYTIGDLKRSLEMNTNSEYYQYKNPSFKAHVSKIDNKKLNVRLYYNGEHATDFGQVYGYSNTGYGEINIIISPIN